MILQLSVNALERLLAGDSELEVQLRHQVVQEFTKHHLKHLVAEPAMKDLADRVTAEIKEHVGEMVWGSRGWQAQVKDRVKQIIDDAVKVSLEQAIAACDKAEFGKRLMTEAEERVRRYELRMLSEVNSKVNAAICGVEKVLSARVDQFFEDRVQAEVKRRLEAAAGMGAADAPR